MYAVQARQSQATGKWVNRDKPYMKAIQVLGQLFLTLFVLKQYVVKGQSRTIYIPNRCLDTSAKAKYVCHPTLRATLPLSYVGLILHKLKLNVNLNFFVSCEPTVTCSLEEIGRSSALLRHS